MIQMHYGSQMKNGIGFPQKFKYAIKAKQSKDEWEEDAKKVLFET